MIDLYSIVPIDRTSLLESGRRQRRILTVEDHYAHGGLGDAVLSAVATEGMSYKLAVREIRIVASQMSSSTAMELECGPLLIQPKKSSVNTLTWNQLNETFRITIAQTRSPTKHSLVRH